MLNPLEINKVITKYEQILNDLINKDGLSPNLISKFIHLHSMIPQIRELVIKEEFINAVNFIYFIQGALYVANIFSINQINHDNIEMRKDSQREINND